MIFRSVSWRIPHGVVIAVVVDVESTAWICPAVSAPARSAALEAPSSSRHVMTTTGASLPTTSVVAASVEWNSQLTTHLELVASANGAGATSRTGNLKTAPASQPRMSWTRCRKQCFAGPAVIATKVSPTTQNPVGRMRESSVAFG